MNSVFNGVKPPPKKTIKFWCIAKIIPEMKI